MMGGIGKTACIKNVAKTLNEHYPDQHFITTEINMSTDTPENTGHNPVHCLSYSDLVNNNQVSNSEAGFIYNMVAYATHFNGWVLVSYNPDTDLSPVVSFSRDGVPDRGYVYASIWIENADRFS